MSTKIYAVRLKYLKKHSACFPPNHECIIRVRVVIFSKFQKKQKSECILLIIQNSSYFLSFEKLIHEMLQISAETVPDQICIRMGCEESDDPEQVGTFIGPRILTWSEAWALAGAIASEVPTNIFKKKSKLY